MLPIHETADRFAAMYLGIIRKSRYNQFLLWALALALLVSQTLAVSHIHHHPESENETVVVLPGLTSADFHLTQAATLSDTEQHHDDTPAEHDESCELCLLLYISWLPASNFTAFNQFKVHDIAVAPQHTIVSRFYSTHNSRAPPLFS